MARWVVGHECEVERVRSRYSTTIMLTARPPIGGRFGMICFGERVIRWERRLERASYTYLGWTVVIRGMFDEGIYGVWHVSMSLWVYYRIRKGMDFS